MKRANHLTEKIAEPENLRLAFWKAKRGKSRSAEMLTYQANLEVNLSALREQIRSGLVEVGEYRTFKIFDPKEREICAAAFGEQVLHHALMNVCHEHFERMQDYDSYASRPGKGVHAALDRARGYARRYEWFLKLDVSKFFGSVHHEVVKEQLERLFKDRLLLDIFGKILDTYETEPSRGLPIGNLTSQYFANHFLAGLDHFIKQELRCPAYVRYMDDMVIWHDDKAALKAMHERIGKFVQARLLCRLKPELLNRSGRGLPFLGFLLFPYRVRLSQRSKQRFVKKMRVVTERLHSGEWDEAVCRERALPLVAFTQYAQAKAFRNQVFSTIYAFERQV